MVNKKPLGTIVLEGMDVNLSSSTTSDTSLQIAANCSTLQVIDHIIDNPVNRRPLQCEPLDGNDASEKLLQLKVVTQLVAHAARDRTRHNKNGKNRGLFSARTYQKPPNMERIPQTSIMMHLDSLHLTLIARFCYDLMFFWEEVWAMSEGLRESLKSKERGPDQCLSQKPRYSTTTKVTLTDFRMDIPRHSYSDELYSFCCGHATITFPAAYTYLQRLHAESGRYERMTEDDTLAAPAQDSWLSYIRYAYSRMHQECLQRKPFSRNTRVGESAGCIHNFHHWNDGEDAGIVCYIEQAQNILGTTFESQLSAYAGKYGIVGAIIVQLNRTIKGLGLHMFFLLLEKSSMSWSLQFCGRIRQSLRLFLHPPHLCSSWNSITTCSSVSRAARSRQTAESHMGMRSDGFKLRLQN
eukprot:jgi/Botrbrau1/4827/Bobra.0325s0041.1